MRRNWKGEELERGGTGKGGTRMGRNWKGEELERGGTGKGGTGKGGTGKGGTGKGRNWKGEELEWGGTDCFILCSVLELACQQFYTLCVSSFHGPVKSSPSFRIRHSYIRIMPADQQGNL